MKRALILTLALASSCMASAAFGQAAAAWAPARQVSLVVPYAPGGGTDATARAVAHRLSKIWGQPVVVENVGGAGGLLGTRRVIDAAPDGHTLLFQVPSLLLMKYQPSLKGIDPVSRLEPVSAVATSPTALVIGASLPIRSLAELVQHCRRAAQPCSAGSGENSSKVRARQFAADNGLPELTVISYRGTGPIVTDLVGGNLTMAFTGITAALPLHKTGRVRILATHGNRRALALPDVPTSMEAGWADSYSVTWYGVLAPRGTSPRITEAVARALKQSGDDAEVQRAIALAGAEPAFMTPAGFAALIRQDDARLSALARRFPFE